MFIADAAWVATAVLQQERPDEDFSLQEISAKAAALGFTKKSVYAHLHGHAVANRKPDGGHYRMLFESAPKRRRLYRPGDPCDPNRKGKITPKREDLPDRWRDLLRWYESWAQRQRPDPLRSLWGTGRKIWADEPADAYVERLRSQW
ncbi:MAG TPA: hypothetical protein VN709_13490 [Terriglobales bacterium]|nr:hypothetical protein [Terriglobales bacterium]